MIANVARSGTIVRDRLESSLRSLRFSALKGSREKYLTQRTQRNAEIAEKTPTSYAKTLFGNGALWLDQIQHRSFVSRGFGRFLRRLRAGQICDLQQQIILIRRVR